MSHTVPRQSRDAQLDAIVLELLRARPDRLAGILEALGVPATDSREAHAKLDPRRCKVCGAGYVRCRTMNDKAGADQHDWTPDRSRSDDE